MFKGKETTAEPLNSCAKPMLQGENVSWFYQTHFERHKFSMQLLPDNQINFIIACRIMLTGEMLVL